MSSTKLSIEMLLSLTDRITAPLRRVVHSVEGIGDAADRSARRLTRLNNQMKTLARDAQKLDAIGKPLLAAGVAGAAGIGLTLAKYAELEEAQMRLKLTTMSATGAVGPEYEKLARFAEKLEKTVPGSTKDMLEMFTALREQGVPASAILGGIGKATAQMAAVMKVGGVEAATYVAKFSESMGVAETDMGAFMDTLQRLKVSAGVEIGDLAETFKYAGGSMKLLNLQGLEATRQFSTAISVLAANGIEGSQAGTNMAQALARMAEVGHRLDAGKVKELVGPLLAAKGIKLDFFDQAGNFRGIREMVGELEKLNALTSQDQVVALKKLFGDEAARPLAVLMKSGVAGYDAMARKMAGMATLQDKVNEIMGTTNEQWKSLNDAVSSAGSGIGKAFASVINLPAVMGKISEVLYGIAAFTKEHPRLTGALAGIVATVTAIALAGGGLLMTIAGIGAAVGPVLTGLSALSRIVGMLGGGIRLIVTAGRALSLVMALAGVSIGPVLIAVAALAAAAYLIYKNWGPITKFFTKIWTTVQDVAGKMFTAGQKLIQMLWEGIKSMAMKPVEAIKAIVQKIRNHLPFSPAKEGPLRDIHRIRLVETIAETMKPGPMVRAMRTATAATMVAVGSTGAAAHAQGVGGGSFVVTQTFNLAPGTPSEVRTQVERGAAMSKIEFERILKQVLDQQQRRGF